MPAPVTAATWWTLAMSNGVDDATLASRQAGLQVEAGELLEAMAAIDVLRAIGPLLASGSYVSG
jgi:hypothetical protein